MRRLPGVARRGKPGALLRDLSERRAFLSEDVLELAVPPYEGMMIGRFRPSTRDACDGREVTALPAKVQRSLVRCRSPEG